MSTQSQNQSQEQRAAEVLSKAVVRVSERLGIKGTTLSKVLGISAPTVSRMFKGAYTLNPKSKEWDFATLLVRVYRSLDSIVGNDETARQWLRSDNLDLGARPIDLLTKTEGIVYVSQYLDASRGIN